MPAFFYTVALGINENVSKGMARTTGLQAAQEIS
jgi:hypothetical protein